MYKCINCEKEFKKRKAYIAHCKIHLSKEIKCNKCEKIFKYNRSFTKHICKVNKLKRSNQFLSGKYKNHSTDTIEKIRQSSFGRKLSENTKEKISKSRIKYLLENPDKVPYLVNHSSKKSFPEKVFENALKESGISGWVYHYQNGIYQYDFAFPKLKIDIEIDGGTHLTDKVKKIDKRRDKFSKDNGWKVIRFTAKEVKENVIGCIKKICFRGVNGSAPDF